MLNKEQAAKLDEGLHTLIDAGYKDIYIGDPVRTSQGVNPGMYPEEMTITIYCRKEKGHG